MNTEERFERIEAGIRDLIVVSRTVLNSVEHLVEAQKRTDERLNSVVEKLDSFDGKLNSYDEKLNILIQTQSETEQKISRLSDLVDKLIRYRGPNGQGN